MDSSVRQMGNHLEFDPEWQTAFTLFGKLSIVIYHLIDWCSSDRMVLIKAYRCVPVAVDARVGCFGVMGRQ